jgi:nitrite reductase/ring-hydroxylating ferredoxin subunit
MATGSRARTRHVVGKVDELPPGTTKVVEVKGRSIGVFNDLGRFSALRNLCPHHGAPLCLGGVSGMMRTTEPHVYEFSGDSAEERVVRCPWHGYEFRISDGKSVTIPERMAVRTYRVEVEDDDVVLYV